MPFPARWFSGFVLLVASIVPLRAQTVVTAPIDVPLYSTTIDTGQQKLGIYLSVGGGTPQIFEFDTGGSGLYTSYASEDPSNSPWVGSGVTTSTVSANNSYDSGLVYSGDAGTASVSLYQEGNDTPLVSTDSSVTVGVVTSITNSKNGTTYWTAAGNSGTTPPVNGAFYGDFGMGLKYSSNSIVNVIAQLSYANGMIPGYIINASGPTPYLQIGLTSQEVSNPSTLLFSMTTDPAAPNGATIPGSNSSYYAGQPINAVLNLSGSGGTTYTSGTAIPIDLDTGASTTLHDYSGPFIDESGSGLDPDVSFSLTGTTTSGTTATFFNFVTTDTVDAGYVAVQSDSKYYLNTGISIFNDYGVMYDLQSGDLGLIPTPEPNPAALALLGAGIAICTGVRLQRKRTPSTDIP